MSVLQKQAALHSRPTDALPSSRPAEQPKNIIIEIKGENGQVKKEVFKWGPILGKGAYAACHEVTQLSSGDIFACKIFPKEKLTSDTSKNRFLTEISVHRSVVHRNIVRFYAIGSGSEEYYMLLEKCNNKSLRQVVRARSKLSEDEVRFWMAQLLDGLNYLHANHICHRDLKLDNIFLHNMQVKLGDFGFSIRLLPNETTKTFCGTPNYIAPEVVARIGYSLPVDIWAFGVLAYTMLVGTPPFETAAAETTYAKITANDYSFPEDIELSDEARDLIVSCLQHSPSDRPTTQELLKHEFFNVQRIPLTLPASALGFNPNAPAQTTVPNAKKRARAAMEGENTDSTNSVAPATKRLALPEHNKENTTNPFRAAPVSTPTRQTRAAKREVMQDDSIPSATPKMVPVAAAPAPRTPKEPKYATPPRRKAAGRARTITAAQAFQSPKFSPSHAAERWDQDRHENELRRIIERLNEIASVEPISQVPATPPPCVTPHEAHKLGHHWIVKWVDYSQRFGLGFQFCDDTLGVYFNDKSSLLSKSNSPVVTYTKYVEVESTNNDPQQQRQFDLVTEHIDLKSDMAVIQNREHVSNRIKLLEHFSDYIKTKLVASSGLAMACDSASHVHDEGEYALAKPEEAPMRVIRWVKTVSAIGFLFANYTVQINFYDHVKLVITLPDTAANPEAVELITVVSENGAGTTRTAKQLMEGGVMTTSLLSKLQFAAALISKEFIAYP